MTRPPSTPEKPSGLGSQPFNYIRNSVKVVMDAYDGTMTFYVADDHDPLIRAWEGVFPTLFHPISEMPADLVPHLRVPEDLAVCGFDDTPYPVALWVALPASFLVVRYIHWFARSPTRPEAFWRASLPAERPSHRRHWSMAVSLALPVKILNGNSPRAKPSSRSHGRNADLSLR